MNGKYLAAGAGMFTAIGRNVEIRNSQSDGKDEWNLEAYTVTFYGITNENHDHISVLNNASIDLSDNKISNVNVREGAISSNLCKNELLATNIFTSRSHGGSVMYANSPNTVFCTKIYLDDVETSILYSENYSAMNSSSTYISDNDSCIKLDIALFVGCKTARGGKNANNLASKVVQNGARVSIGFSENIGCEAANIWTQEFYTALLEGKSVGESVIDAEEASGISCTVICGDENFVLHLP